MKRMIALLLIGLTSFTLVIASYVLNPVIARSSSPSLTGNSTTDVYIIRQVDELSDSMTNLDELKMSSDNEKFLLVQDSCSVPPPPPPPFDSPADKEAWARFEEAWASKEAIRCSTEEEIVNLINQDYPNWKNSLPDCPCKKSEIDQLTSDFVEADWDAYAFKYLWTDYHPGAKYDYRQTESTLEEHRLLTNPDIVIRPGQQCTYDSDGMLITHGLGAGTPDIFSPAGGGKTGIGAVIIDTHVAWDVEPFDKMVGDPETEILNKESLREYHRTWTPNPGKDKKTGKACPINPEPEDRSGDKNRGRNFGDPHLFTFDGYRYSFQLVGEFVLARSDDDLFEVQVRQSPINSSLSVDSAVAMKIANDRVALYADELPDTNTNTPLRVNGVPTVVDRELSLKAGGKIYHRGDDYVFEWPTGEELVAQVNKDGENPFINITAYIFESQANKISGLLGNANGDTKDDLRFRDGKVLPPRDAYGDIESLVERASPVRLPLDSALNLYLSSLTKDYGNNWRISQAESLFDYAPDQSTQTFTLSNFPAEYLALEKLSSTELSDARAACIDTEVEPELMEGCVFDVAFSGRSDFARAAARISQTADILREFGIDVPDIEREIRNRLPKLPGGIRIPRLPF